METADLQLDLSVQFLIHISNLDNVRYLTAVTVLWVYRASDAAFTLLSLLSNLSFEGFDFLWGWVWCHIHCLLPFFNLAFANVEIGFCQFLYRLPTTIELLANSCRVDGQ